MNWFIFLLTFLCINLTSARIVFIKTPKNVKGKSKSPLLIPCKFFTSEDDYNPFDLHMEWNFFPENGTQFIPIVRVIGGKDTRSKRAEVFSSDFRKGNCSLRIKSARVKDSGTYELQISSQGLEFHPFNKVEVKVLKSPGNDTEEIEVVTTAPTVQTTTKKQVGLDPGIAAFLNWLQYLKSKGLLRPIQIVVVVFLVFLVIGALAGCLGCALYCKLRADRQDDIEMQREEQERKKAEKPPNGPDASGAKLTSVVVINEVAPQQFIVPGAGDEQRKKDGKHGK